MNKYLRTFTELLMMSGAAIGFVYAVSNNDELGGLVMGAAFVFLAGMLLVRVGQPRFKTLSRQSRTAIVAAGLWVVTLQAWGFIWEWDRYFDGQQFFALHLAVPLIALAAWRGLRWATR